MPSQWQSLLLVGGLALIGVGVVVAIVVMTLVVVRRQRRESAAPRLGDAFGRMGTGSPEAVSSGGRAGIATDLEASGVPQVPFVASRQDSQPVARLEPMSPPTGASASAPSAWGDIIAAELSLSEDAGYTTGSFAPPGQAVTETPTVSPRPDAEPQPIVEPIVPAELTTPPLANPWLGTGPQPPSGGSVLQEGTAPESDAGPAAEPIVDAVPSPPDPDADAEAVQARPVAAPPANPTETVPTIVVGHVPLAAPAAPPAVEERESAADAFVPEPFVPAVDAGPGEDDDRTVALGGTKRAPWLLVLDTGERIAVPAESVVLGRKPAPIEHGVPGVVVPDATKTVSKVHARLDRSGEHWTVTDLGSTNGCSIIEAGGRERLLPSGGSEVIRGRFLLGEVGMILVRNPEGPGL